MIVLMLCGALYGCHHQPIAAPMSAKAQTPNIFLPPPPPTDLHPMAPPALPAVVTDAKPPVAEELKPKKKVKRPPPVAAPVVPAAAPEPTPVETATLGALAPGGDSNPQQQQEAAGKIAGVEKRLNDLPARVVEQQQKQIAKVKLFLKEASDALKGGDVDGAKILATKADLLVDDILK
jgi:hypothetical protein